METQIPRQRPQAVTTAVKLLWAYTAIDLLQVIKNFSRFENHFALAAITSLLLFLLQVLLIFKISEGRNWARNTILVGYTMLTPKVIFSLPHLFLHYPVDGIMGVAITLIGGWALYLLFNPSGCIWFNPSQTTQETPRDGNVLQQLFKNGLFRRIYGKRVIKNSLFRRICEKRVIKK